MTVSQTFLPFDNPESFEEHRLGELRLELVEIWFTYFLMTRFRDRCLGRKNHKVKMSLLSHHIKGIINIILLEMLNLNTSLMCLLCFFIPVPRCSPWKNVIRYSPHFKYMLFSSVAFSNIN